MTYVPTAASVHSGYPHCLYFPHVTNVQSRKCASLKIAMFLNYDLPCWEIPINQILNAFQPTPTFQLPLRWIITRLILPDFFGWLWMVTYLTDTSK
jgi:hypothetical protein